MDHRRVSGHRPLCVSVRHPRHLDLLGRAAVATAVACVGAGVWWRVGMPAAVALAVAAAGIAGWRHRTQRHQHGARIRALRAFAGSPRWQVRMGRQWHGAVLHNSRRGNCWLELRLQTEAAAGLPVAHHRVAVWRSTVSAPSWRRLCVLAGAAQRLNAPEPRAA